MKILVLCARVPYPLTDGESLRIFNYAKRLAQRHELDLVCVGDESAVDDALRAVFHRIEVVAPAAANDRRQGVIRRFVEAFRVASFAMAYDEVAARLASLLGEQHYDVIWTSSDLARCIPGDRRMPVLADVCDDGVLLLRRELARTGGWLSRLRLWKRVQVARRFEQRYFGPADACLFVSSEDAESFRAQVPGARAEVIPNGVDADYFSPSDDTVDSATLVFEGSMDFAPNADAAVSFCRELLPAIRARRPDVRVMLVGRDPTPEVLALASDVVTVTGRVEDIRPYLARATVFICPLKMGAGIKNKILQAWSMGKAVVATPVSLGGLDYVDGGNLVVGRTPESFIEAVLKLLDEPAKRALLGESARQTVVGAYRWESRVGQFDSLLESLVRPYAAHRQIERAAGLDAVPGAPRVLMFALQFPPYSLSTGRLRTLGFVRHLPASGWIPYVLTAREQAFVDGDARTLADVPKGTHVIRAMGTDMARLAAFKGVYPRWVATPDRWNLWAAGAMLAGMKAVKLHRIDVLWATFPVPSALLAALVVRRMTGLPLVADLRDPIVYETWPDDRWARVVYGWIERRIVRSAATVVLTTPRACQMYRERYRDVPPERFQEIANGIDELDAASAAQLRDTVQPGGPITLVHSGLMEIPDRDPRPFFAALSLLRLTNALPKRSLKIVLRASGREEEFRSAAQAAGVDDLIALGSRLPHQDAFAELKAATGLLLFQGAACNRQIPAKAYEYLASGRPIIGLMDPQGDTHALVSGKWCVPYCADMGDPDAIASTLTRFFADFEADRAYVPPASMVASYRRSSQAAELAQLLERVRRTGQRDTDSGMPRRPRESAAG